VEVNDKELSQKIHVDLRTENRILAKKNSHAQKPLSKPGLARHHRYLIYVTVKVEILGISHTELVKIASS
jgi:hypothetical protein